jgi:antitoxin VapB
MSLNVKNQEIQRLAAELAALTGESIMVAVAEALRERLERVRHVQNRDLAERLMAIGKDCAAHLSKASDSADYADFLYDERGLPC